MPSPLILVIIIITTSNLVAISQSQLQQIVNKSSIINAVIEHINQEDPAVTKLREYLRINTSHPNPDYESGIQWFHKQAKYYGLKFNLVRFKEPDLFAVWLTWPGRNPNLKSILLNSHMDVVAVDRDKWIHDPFSAYKDAKGNIYARGAKDMKSTTISRLEAIRRLQIQGFKPLRTVHVSVIPDEEIGGEHGMKAFVNSPEFKKLNVGLDLDEGGGLSRSSDGTIHLSTSNGHKSAWQFNITANGLNGHGSAIARSGTAGHKIRIVIDRLMDFKESEIQKLNNPNVTSSDITSVNLVQLGGGIGNNVLPPSLWAFFDMRIRILPNNSSWSFEDYDNFLNETCKAAGPGVSYEFFQKGKFPYVTPFDITNAWWKTRQEICDEMNWVCDPPKIISPTTDGGYVRNVGIPVFGFGVGLSIYGKKLGGVHGDNEGINEKDFLGNLENHMFAIKKFSMVSEKLHP